MSDYFLQLARDAYESSTDYVDSNYRQKWEDALNLFNSRHPSGSKYHKPSYAFRNKIFRPKTRATIRNSEAAAMAAFFGNQDVVSCEPTNPTDNMQRVSAEICQELLNYRLNKTIPWYQTLIGGIQDAMTVGVVCSRQEWIYETRPVKYIDRQVIVDALGNEIEQEVEIDAEEVIKDHPAITLIPVENLRIDPSADWRDPVNSSPYLIELVPMRVMDIEARMESVDGKTGEPKWKKYDRGELRAGMDQSYDSTRSVREEGREEKYEEEREESLTDFSIVWCHRNIAKVRGEDMVWWTVGTELMLSSPVPLSELTPGGMRPYVMGVSVIEAHKLYPDGLVGLGAEIQKELNHVINQRMDNVQLVLNKRYFARRGAQIDLKSMTRNVPASVTLMNDPINDVRVVDFPDVTSSAYAEQDRLNLDFDEVTGAFSQGSVMTNRSLNETVGGMGMLRGSSNMATEYLLRTMAETWVEPVLNQMLKLEQAYETDMVVLNYARDKAQLFQRYGQGEITDEMLNQNLAVTVNVGMGATDPMLRLERFLMAIDRVVALEAAPVPDMDKKEVRKEIFAKLGYKDGQRFFREMEQDPRMMQMQQQMQMLAAQNQELVKMLNDKQGETQAKILTAQMDNETKLAIEALKQQQAQREMVTEYEQEVLLEQLGFQHDRALKLLELYRGA